MSMHVHMSLIHVGLCIYLRVYIYRAGAVPVLSHVAREHVGVLLGLGEDDDLGAFLVDDLLHDALQLARLVVVLAHLHERVPWSERVVCKHDTQMTSP